LDRDPETGSCSTLLATHNANGSSGNPVENVKEERGNATTLFFQSKMTYN